MSTAVKFTTNAGPPVLEGFLAFGVNLQWVADQIGVSIQNVSKWYRYERGMTAKHALLLTGLLGTMIEAAKEGLEGDELPESAKQALRIRLQSAQSWYDLQYKANNELPPLARGEALALHDVRVEAVKGSPRRVADYQKRESHPQPASTRVAFVQSNNPKREGRSDA